MKPSWHKWILGAAVATTVCTPAYAQKKPEGGKDELSAAAQGDQAAKNVVRPD